MIYKAHIIDTPTPDQFRIIPNGYVHVNDQGIIEGVYETLPPSLTSEPITDFGDQLLIPAFYDLHIHAPQYRNMGLAMDLPLLEWLQTYTFPEESKFVDLQYAERIYRRFVHELWMQGTMRASVFATVHTPATHLLMKLFEEAGLGAYIGLVAMNRNCPSQLTNTLQELDDFYKQSGSKRVKPIITPRFIPSCSRDMLKKLGDLAAQYQLPVQSHLSENKAEIRLVHKLMPEVLTYGDGYLKYGLWGQTPTLMAHCCHSHGRELRLLKKHDVIVVHCPTSNCNLGSGAAPVRRFLKKGIRVALGTDVSGGHNASMLRVMQYTLQTSKLYQTFSLLKEPALKVSEAFYLATKSGGSFFGKCGSFEKGYEFDALVVNDAYLNAEKYTLPQRIERYIFIGDDRDIKHRFCAGHELAEPKLAESESGK